MMENNHLEGSSFGLIEGVFYNLAGKREENHGKPQLR
jgi:hypothetical protein